MEQLNIEQFKAEVHRTLISRLDLEKLSRVNSGQARHAVAGMISEIISSQRVPLNLNEQDKMQEELLDEVFGLGPLEPLLRDKSISDIMVNGKDNIFIEKGGILRRVDASFRDDRHLMQIIDRIVSRIGRRIDESSPMVDARLTDGSRVNAIIPPLALDGPILSIRRFGRTPLMVDDLIRINSITAEIADLIRAMVRARLNILVSGGTGSGKTTLLNCLSSFIPDTERIVTIEDSAELQLQQPHVVRLETRPPNIEGRGEVTQRDLVKNSLRMRPDRIIVGEVRGSECLDMLQAMNTGHDGSISTVHANSARDSLNRMEMMMQMTGFDIPIKAMRQQISAALDAIVHTARLADGSRKVTGISEVVGMEGDTIMLQELFTFQREGKDADGNIIGRFASTGIRPHFADKLKHSGGEVDSQALGFLRA